MHDIPMLTAAMISRCMRMLMPHAEPRCRAVLAHAKVSLWESPMLQQHCTASSAVLHADSRAAAAQGLSTDPVHRHVSCAGAPWSARSVSCATVLQRAAMTSSQPPTHTSQSAVPAHTESKQAAVDALAAWIQGLEPQPAQLVPRRIPGRGGGWGLVAAQPIRKGQQLVAVPRRATMSAVSAVGCPVVGVAAAAGGLNDWQMLSLHLLAERARGASSFWAPFLARLPDQADHPLLWGPERRAWLAGSPMAATLADRLQQVQEDTTAVESAVRAAAKRGGGTAPSIAGQLLESLVTRDSMAWAAATALSRGFNLRRQDFDDGAESSDWQDDWGVANTLLVPWVDLLNHSSDAGEESSLRGHQHTASLAAHRSYAAGEEVFNTYGPWLSPQDLMLNYGFYDAANENHQATVLFDPAATAAAGSSGGHDAAAHLSGMEMVVGPEGPDTTALTWARAVLSGKEDVFAFGWDPETCDAGDFDPELAQELRRLSEPTDRRLEQSILDAMLLAHNEQLAGYPATAAEDEAAAADERLPWLRRQVHATLATEKRALEGSRAAVASWRDALMSGAPLSRLYEA